MTQLTDYLQLRPTKKVNEALTEATAQLAKTQVYSGKWTKTDTLRYLIAMDYKAHNYPSKNIAREPLRNIKLSDEDYWSAIAKKLDPSESNSGLTYRLVVSGLIQMGFLSVDKRQAKPFDSEVIDTSKLALESLPEKVA